MDKKIQDLWQNNKIVFFLLLIPIALWFCRNLIVDLLIGSSKKTMEKAEEKSKELEKESLVANTQADQIIKDADKAAVKKDEVTEDWYKKK